MRRCALLLLFALPLDASRCASQVHQLFFTLAGYDYAVPAPGSTHYLDVGDGWRSVGYVTSVDPNELGPRLDFHVNEYTYFIWNLTVQITFISGTYMESDFSNRTGASLRIFEDPIKSGTHGTFGVNPPNPTAPSSFTDGMLILGGSVYDALITYDSSSGQGEFELLVDLDEGSDLLDIPEHMNRGWTLSSSALRPPNKTVPLGYDHLLSGTCYRDPVVPVAHRTWGAVKALYR